LEGFEKYPWPELTDDNFYIHQYIAKNLPDGLGFITCHVGGVYEHVSRLMGYMGLCYKLYDDRELVKAVADKIGGLIFRYNEKLLKIDNVHAIMQGDDFGFNTQTLIPPDDIREFHSQLLQYRELSDHAGRSITLIHGNAMEIDSWAASVVPLPGKDQGYSILNQSIASNDYSRINDDYLVVDVMATSNVKITVSYLVCLRHFRQEQSRF